jgi:hypothetical protein
MGNTQEIAVNLASDFAVYSEVYENVVKHNLACFSDLNELLGASSFDVVHLLIKVGRNTSIYRNEAASLAKALKKANPGLVWFAEENPIENYQDVFNGLNVKPAHLILTVERRGQVFPRFLHDLLTELVAGESLTGSYVKLVPQGPGPWQDSLPASLVVVGSDNRRYRN